MDRTGDIANVHPIARTLSNLSLHTVTERQTAPSAPALGAANGNRILAAGGWPDTKGVADRSHRLEATEPADQWTSGAPARLLSAVNRRGPAVQTNASPPSGDEVSARTVVAVVDDDPGVRGFIQDLLESVGLFVKTFASTQQLMDGLDPASISCLVLDVRLPGKNGLEFHVELQRAGIATPVVFITGYGDIAMGVRAMKSGAVEFLAKPFGDQDLLDAVQRGVEEHRRRRAFLESQSTARARFETLTSREREVMAEVVRGRRNKAIAQALGISVVTVKAHRRQVMLKMQAETIADLIRAAYIVQLIS
jgi:FixJ family two-component response regulator